MAGGSMSGMSGSMWMPHLAPTLARLFQVHLQPIPLLPALGLVALAAYLLGVVQLHRRGDAWPVSRTAFWVLGILALWAVTATGIEGYGMMLMSVHMSQHMALTMFVPILLLAASPITLLLRTLPSHGRGSGVRRAVLVALHSRAFQVLTSAPVRWFFFVSALFGVYLTRLFDVLMSSVWGHYVMLVHFLVTGLLFFGPLVDADPWPRRLPAVMRIVETLSTGAVHAFFGIYFMMAATPVVSFFTHPPASWHVDVLADQSAAGGIAWATSELPTVLLFSVIFVQWFRSEERAAVRYDRHAARTGDAELVAYNAHLARLAAADSPGRR